MGRQIAVDSVVYNMAGEVADRPNYLKSLVARHTLSGSRDSMADAIRNGYFKGPGQKLGAFYRWAKDPNNYGLVGFPTGSLEANGKIPLDKVAQQIGAPAGYKNDVLSGHVGYADTFYWAERYMLNNHLELYTSDWESDYFKASNQIRIKFEDGRTERFFANDYSNEERYVYTYYNRVNTETKAVGRTRLFIYRLGSGNADLDRLVEKKAEYGEFFPFIPIRLDNKFISSVHKPNVRKQTDKAYKKATGGSLKELIEDLKDNKSLDDIDHAYVVFGVSLNTQENAARRYVYTFFEKPMAYQNGGDTAYSAYLKEVAVYHRSVERKAKWLQLNPKKRGPEPIVLPIPTKVTNSIRIRGNGEINTFYDMRIVWDVITSHTRMGRGKPGAKKGDVWMTSKRIIAGYSTREIQMGDGRTMNLREEIPSTELRIYWQRSKTEYTFLKVIGAEHFNNVYGVKKVKIDTKDALADANESGFIVPLHYDTWKAMSMIDTNQMSMSCVYCVFNCYKIRKTRWYESGIFRIFLVIVIAVASAIFTGGAGIGLLGSHLAVGSAFGLSGMSAAILGSVVNAMAAMIVTTIIEKMASSLGILGPLVSFLMGTLIGAAMSSITSGGLINFNWSNLLSIDNLMKLTTAVGNTMTAAINQDTLGIQQDWADFQENADDKALKIQQAYFEEFGYGAGAIDPMMLLETTRNDFAAESPSTFLTRTLMTGSDLAEMSRELLYDFPKYSLELPDAFS